MTTLREPRRRERTPPLEEVGRPPDPRFTLANERTFLAWIRTTLALLAAGLAIVEFLHSQRSGIRLAIGVPLMVLGALVSARAYARWETVERALRLDQPIPYGSLPRLIGVGVAAISLLASALVVLRP